MLGIENRTLSYSKTLKGRVFPLNQFNRPAKFLKDYKIQMDLFSSILLFKLLRNLTQGFSFDKFSTHFVVDGYVRLASLFSLPSR